MFDLSFISWISSQTEISDHLSWRTEVGLGVGYFQFGSLTENSFEENFWSQKPVSTTDCY